MLRPLPETLSDGRHIRHNVVMVLQLTLAARDVFARCGRKGTSIPRERALQVFVRSDPIELRDDPVQLLDSSNEERLAKEPVESKRLTPPEIVDYTRSLPRLWADSGPDGRQAIVAAIFSRLDVLGFERLEYELTPDAIDLGLDAALPPILKLTSQIGEFGRGERASTHANDVTGTVRVAPRRATPQVGVVA